MPALALAIVASVAAGVWARRRHDERALALTRRLLDAMLHAALPFIVFFVLVRAELTAGAGIGLLLGYASLAITGVFAYVLATRALRLPTASAAMVVIAAIMANSGFFGAPVIATLLGSDDLGAAITYDALVSGPMFFVVALRMALAPLLLLALAATAIDIPGAYLAQATMPVGVNTLVVAHAYDLDRGLAAAALAWSTALALLTALVASALA